MLYKLNEFIKNSPKHSYLSIDNYSGNYTEEIKDLCFKSSNDCHYLSSYPFYVDDSLEIHLFDE